MNLDELERECKETISAAEEEGEYLEISANPSAILELIERLRDAEGALDKVWAENDSPEVCSILDDYTAKWTTPASGN